MQFLHKDHKIQFMDKYSIESDYQLWSFKVDVETIDTIIVPEFSSLLSNDNDSLFILDEIGRAELLSLPFQHMIETIFDNPNINMIATIVRADDPLQAHKNTTDLSMTETYKNSADIVIMLTEQNREKREEVLWHFIQNIEHYKALNQEQKIAFRALVKQAANKEDFILLKKLFKNVLEYIWNDQVTFYEKGATVEWNHDLHHVLDQDGVITCDCPLFNGRDQFEGKASICSHVISYQLLKEHSNLAMSATWTTD